MREGIIERKREETTDRNRWREGTRDYRERERERKGKRERVSERVSE